MTLCRSTNSRTLRLREQLRDVIDLKASFNTTRAFRHGGKGRVSNVAASGERRRAVALRPRSRSRDRRRVPGCRTLHSIAWWGGDPEALAHSPWHCTAGEYRWNGDLEHPSVEGVVAVSRARYVHPALGTVIDRGWRCEFSLARGAMAFAPSCAHRLRSATYILPLIAG
jgi:hypothetical protein